MLLPEWIRAINDAAKDGRKDLHQRDTAGMRVIVAIKPGAQEMVLARLDKKNKRLEQTTAEVGAAFEAEVEKWEEREERAKQNADLRF